MFAMVKVVVIGRCNCALNCWQLCWHIHQTVVRVHHPGCLAARSGAAGCTLVPYIVWFVHTPGKQGSRDGSPHILCAIVLLHIYWKTGQTCGPSRFCLGIATSRLPRSTCMLLHIISRLSGILWQASWTESLLSGFRGCSIWGVAQVIERISSATLGRGLRGLPWKTPSFPAWRGGDMSESTVAAFRPRCARRENYRTSKGLRTPPGPLFRTWV
jgi:hypothetical protein